MRICRKSLLISSQFLRNCTIKNSFFSSAPSLSSLDPLISHEPTSVFSSNHSNAANYPIPISNSDQNPNFLSQTYLIRDLLQIKNQPLCALEYYKWAENQPGFDGGICSFCVLFHILMSFDKCLKKSDLKRFFDSLQCSNIIVLMNCVIDTANSFGFKLDCRIFHSLLYGLKCAHRFDDAVSCFDWIVENHVVDLDGSFGEFLLIALVKRNRIKEAEKLFDKMIWKRVWGSSRALGLMMTICLDRGRVKEADDLLRNAKQKGVGLGDKAYNAAVQMFCLKRDFSSAFELLVEMKERKLVPSMSVLMKVMNECREKGKMREALWVRDEMIFSEKTLHLEDVTGLMDGCCRPGDWEGELSLFARMSEDGLSSGSDLYEVLIEGSCSNGNVDKACELYCHMVGKGIQPSVYTSVLIIKKSANFLLKEMAFEQLANAAKSSKLDVSACSLLMSWLCIDGKVREARVLLEEIVSRHSRGNNAGMKEGFEHDAVTFTILMDGHFKKGEVENAFKVLDEMFSQNINCTPYTYNTIVRGLCEFGHSSRAWSMLQKFTEEENFRPSWVTYDFLINAFAKEGDMDSEASVITEMNKRGISPNVKTSNIIKNRLCRRHKLDLSLNLRKEMLSKGLVLDISAYKALIDGFLMRKDMKNAYSMFSELLDAGLTPDDDIYNSMIAGYRNLSQGKKKRKKEKRNRNCSS